MDGNAKTPREARTVVITGASRGIGRATALALSKEGLNVVVNYLQSKKEAEQLVKDIKEGRGSAIAVSADVSSEVDVRRLVAKTINTFGSIDFLVNNAGVILRPGDWQNIDSRIWHRTIDINLTGTFNCIKAVAPYMISQKRGRIVNLTSTYGILGAAPVIAYTSAKAAIISLTRSFAKALAPHVTVNAVAPGNIDTEMTRGAGEDFLKIVIDSTPLKRLGTPEDVANAISFLVSEKSDFITGQVLIVDGGHILK